MPKTRMTPRQEFRSLQTKLAELECDLSRTADPMYGTQWYRGREDEAFRLRFRIERLRAGLYANA